MLRKQDNSPMLEQGPNIDFLKKLYGHVNVQGEKANRNRPYQVAWVEWWYFMDKRQALAKRRKA